MISEADIDEVLCDDNKSILLPNINYPKFIKFIKRLEKNNLF